jgi:hypothetical protein
MAVDHPGREPRAIEQYFGLNDNRRIVLLALSLLLLADLRVFDRLRRDRLRRCLPRMLHGCVPRMMWCGAETESGADEQSRYAHVHAVKTRSRADQFLRSGSAARLPNMFIRGDAKARVNYVLENMSRGNMHVVLKPDGGLF